MLSHLYLFKAPSAVFFNAEPGLIRFAQVLGVHTLLESPGGHPSTLGSYTATVTGSPPLSYTVSASRKDNGLYKHSLPSESSWGLTGLSALITSPSSKALGTCGTS